MKIPLVDHHLGKLECDKLIFNYLEYPEPYKQLDEFKKQMDYYDYIIIVTNDVIVKKNNLSVLLSDIEELDQPPVISAVMNVDMAENSDKLNICHKWPESEYDWIPRGELKGYQQVEFAGFPLLAIRKDIFLQYDWGNSFNAGDRRFCKFCIGKNIPIMVNVDNEMLHLRYHGEKPTNENRSISWIKNL